jgi:hypothetical protein
MLNPWDFVVLSVGFFMMAVSFLRDVDWFIGKVRQHQNLLRRLMIPKLIGLSILAPSLIFGLTTTTQVLANPDGFIGSLPTMGLCWLGTQAGLEIILPSNGGGL